MSMPPSSGRSSRLPEWLKVALPRGPEFAQTAGLLAALGLHTVCQGANCPNRFECFSRKVATFLILGPTCTRGCAFCNIAPGSPAPPDPDEPRRLCEAAKRLSLAHVVVTSVTRDDLPDGGAAHFAAVVRGLKRALPDASVEVLIPDFQGRESALAMVLESGPDVLNHNLETVAGLYPAVRPQADYARSLALLRRAKAMHPGVLTKSGLMAGLGETFEQLCATLGDLREAGCDIVTVGQYLRPSGRHPEPARYVDPEEFERLAEHGRQQGIPHMYCGPLVRSSLHAERFVRGRAAPGEAKPRES